MGTHSFRKCIAFFENEKLAFYFSNAFNYFEKRKKFILHKRNLPKNNIFEELINDYSVKISSVILRKKILVNSGFFKFDINYNIIGDFDLILKIASKFEWDIQIIFHQLIAHFMVIIIH